MRLNLSVCQTSLLMAKSFLILAVVKYFVFISVVTRLSKSIPEILSSLLAPNSDLPLWKYKPNPLPFLCLFPLFSFFPPLPYPSAGSCLDDFELLY